MKERLDDVLTIEELSAYLKISKSTLYKLVREGKVPCRKIGRHWRFRKRAIDRWLEETPCGSTNRQDGPSGRTEDAPEERGPGRARIETEEADDGGPPGGSDPAEDR